MKVVVPITYTSISVPFQTKTIKCVISNGIGGQGGGGTGDGDVVGPSTAIDSNFASYNGLTGKLIKDSGYGPTSFFHQGANTLTQSLGFDGDFNIRFGSVNPIANFSVIDNVGDLFGMGGGGFTIQSATGATLSIGNVIQLTGGLSSINIAANGIHSGDIQILPNGGSTSGYVLTATDSSGTCTWQPASGGGGTVTSVSGTTNRITSSGGSTPAIDISAAYVGQASITTVGTIASGTWNSAIGTSATATTSSALSNDTKIATNAYADAAVTAASLPAFDATHDGYVANAGVAYKFLYSDGQWLTPGASGTILQSAGATSKTVYSSWTMAAPGTSGNVLTSDGTNWTSAAAAGGTVASLAEALAGTNNTKIITPLRNASVNARVYNVEAYGAMHDYQTVSNASITSGTAALTTGSAAFAASDVGKTIRLFGAGAAGVDLVTTITVFTSSTAVTINTNASTTIASKQIEWGTDDTPFIQLAINACHTAGGGKVYFPNGTYLLAGALVTSLDSVNPNCQLYIPLTQTSETKLTIELVGESSIPFPSGPTAAQNLPTKGAILKSIIIGSGATPSVIGSSFFNDGFTNGNLSICVVRDLSVIVKSMQGTTHIAPKMSAFHMSYFSAKRMYDCMAMTESDPTESIVPSDVTYGFLLSVGSHTDIHSSYQNLTASGYYYAFYVEEHDSWTRLNAYNCLNALGIGGSVDNHPIFSMGSITAHWCKYGIVFLSGKTVNIDYYAERWPGALTSHWYDGTADIYIPSTVAISGFIRGRAATAGTGAVVPLSISGTYTGSLNIFDYYTASYNNTFKIVSSSVGTNLSITGAQGSGGVDSYMTNLTSSGFVRSIWENNRGSFASFAAIAHVGSTASGFNTIFGISSAVDWTFFYQNGASAAGMAIGTVGSAPVLIGTNNVERARFISSGQLGLGVTAPTATIHLKAGTTAASTAPLKLTSGTNMTTAEAGAFEYNGTDLFFTKSGTTRGNVLVATAVTTEVQVSDTTLTITYQGTTYKILAKA